MFNVFKFLLQYKELTGKKFFLIGDNYSGPCTVLNLNLATNGILCMLADESILAVNCVGKGVYLADDHLTEVQLIPSLSMKFWEFLYPEDSIVYHQPTNSITLVGAPEYPYSTLKSKRIWDAETIQEISAIDNQGVYKTFPTSQCEPLTEGLKKRFIEGLISLVKEDLYPGDPFIAMEPNTHYYAYFFKELNADKQVVSTEGLKFNIVLPYNDKTAKLIGKADDLKLEYLF